MGWGAIGDVGVLARDAEGVAKLERISGIVAMRAGEALSHLEGLLARPETCPDTVHCASFRPGAALQGLKLLSTPAFGRLFAAAESGAGEAGIDLASLIARQERDRGARRRCRAWWRRKWRGFSG